MATASGRTGLAKLHSKEQLCGHTPTGWTWLQIPSSFGGTKEDMAEAWSGSEGGDHAADCDGMDVYWL